MAIGMQSAPERSAIIWWSESEARRGEFRTMVCAYKEDFCKQCVIGLPPGANSKQLSWSNQCLAPETENAQTDHTHACVELRAAGRHTLCVALRKMIRLMIIVTTGTSSSSIISTRICRSCTSHADSKGCAHGQAMIRTMPVVPPAA